MQTSIVISGFGGQGTLFSGMVLAYAGLSQGKHVTWMPSYGPEMRGGTANATVIVSDDEIGSPVIYRPDAVIALNHPSVDKYVDRIRSGGVLIYNSSIVVEEVLRSNIEVMPIPAGEIASDLGDIRTANMITLGALVTRLEILPIQSLAAALRDHLLADRPELLEINETALHRGAKLAQSLSRAVA